MKKPTKATKRMCAQGHRFLKSSTCPVCPKCEAIRIGATAGGLPKLGAPATRALNGIGVTTLKQLANHTADELLHLHGFGPSALKILQREMAKRRMTLRSESTGAERPKKTATKDEKKTEMPTRPR